MTRITRVGALNISLVPARVGCAIRINTTSGRVPRHAICALGYFCFSSFQSEQAYKIEDGNLTVLDFAYKNAN